MLSWLLPSSSVHFLLHPYLKRMKNDVLALFILQCSFLITSLFKKDEKCSLADLPCSSANCLLHPYLKIMRNAPLATFSPPVLISYYILVKK